MWIRRLSELSLAACLLLTATRAAAVPPPATSMDDPMEQFRERFKQGMDRYKAGAPAEAIGYWEPIYRELGEQRGYRLAYNLGVAYTELGDATRAAEKLQSFLSEVEARKTRGETLAPIVTKEESDAHSRIDALTAAKGRIHVAAGSPPRAAQVDAGEPRLAGFVAWVSPGDHVVVFAPASAEQETRAVTVHAGELIDVAPTPPPPAPAPPATPPPEVSQEASPSAASAPSPTVRYEPTHPFPPALVITGGAASAALAIAAIPLHQHASSLYGQYSSLPTRTGADAQQFYTARTWAYVTLGGAVGVAAATAGLVAWYFLGTSTREVVVTPAGIAGRF
jgi:hypothetical protein